ncbi:hypothetical protein LSUE1_G001899 [Lachnellula suecica]|uniref:G-patch domain-containing protein n=1 Tax=Lachnellula suecica TaxID=602035 RepID=A0A8T9CDY9_9HELO|nr:hypothetical protein LSUE1_G001899 [Lachnellula suecica]
MSDDDDTYEIPLQDQRVFGAGIKRRRVHFVPSSSTAPSIATSTTPAKSVSDLYLKLVLPGDSKERAGENEGFQTAAADSGVSSTSQGEAAVESQVCEICNLPISDLQDTKQIDLLSKRPSSKSRHEASLAHQVCLEHSHPPSHLDRDRKGLAYLSSYGWDPDSRLGLGASGQGIQFPIKTKPKDDKMGIGVKLPKPGEIKKKEKIKKMDAKQCQKLHVKDRKKTAKLREMFYRNEEVDRYLGRG